jgi:hypothetical protein
MRAASPADCSHSVIITIRTAMPISRIKAIAQEQSSVNGDLVEAVFPPRLYHHLFQLVLAQHAKAR